jgi:hypothetical protein
MDRHKSLTINMVHGEGIEPPSIARAGIGAAAATLFVSTPADRKKAVTSGDVIRFLSERR